jgi:chromosome segregation ATPase
LQSWPPAHGPPEAKKETAALKLQLKEAQSSLSALKATPSMETLEESVGNLEAEVQELESTLATLRASVTKPADPERNAVAEAAYKSIEKVYLTRKKQFKEFWAIICEAHDGKPAELWVSTPLSLMLCLQLSP